MFRWNPVVACIPVGRPIVEIGQVIDDLAAVLAVVRSLPAPPHIVERLDVKSEIICGFLTGKIWTF